MIFPLIPIANEIRQKREQQLLFRKAGVWRVDRQQPPETYIFNPWLSKWQPRWL